MFKIHYHPLSFPSLAPVYADSAIGADYQTELVDIAAGQQKSPEYLAINPYGKVPALEDGDFVMAESAAIMRYIARQTGSDLYPQDAQAQAKVNQWMDYVNHHIRTPVGRVQFNRVIAPMMGAQVDKGSLEMGLQLLENNLPAVEAALSKSPYLCGDKISLADIALVAALDPAEMAKIDISPYKALSAWREARRGEAFYTKVHSHFGAELNL